MSNHVANQENTIFFYHNKITCNLKEIEITYFHLRLLWEWKWPEAQGNGQGLCAALNFQMLPCDCLFSVHRWRPAFVWPVTLTTFWSQPTSCVCMCVDTWTQKPQGQGLVVVSFSRALGLVMKEHVPVACGASAKVMFPVNVEHTWTMSFPLHTWPSVPLCPGAGGEAPRGPGLCPAPRGAPETERTALRGKN